MTEDKKRLHVRDEASPIKILVDKLSAPEVATRLGVSKSTILTAVREGYATRALVLAARYEQSKIDKQNGAPAIACVAVSSDKRVAFDAIVNGLGLDCKYFIR